MIVMGVNRLDINGETVLDLSKDTVTEDTLAEGVTAHNAAGEQIEGTMQSGGSGDSVTELFYVPIKIGANGFELDGMTYADILNAYNDGKHIVAKTSIPSAAGLGFAGNFDIPMTYINDGGSFVFSFTTGAVNCEAFVGQDNSIIYFIREYQEKGADSNNASLGIRYGFDINTGTLYLYGDGKYSSSSSDAFEDITEQVKHIVFFENISELGDMACALGVFPNLETATMCNSITTTGTGVFFNSEKLRKVHLSKNLTALNGQSFNSTAIDEIKIPAAVAVIYAKDFGDCAKLKKVEFEKASELLEIKANAFSGCTALSGIELPNKLTALGSRVFRNNTALRLVTLPATLSSLGSNVFENCTALEFAIYEGTREQWEALEGSANNATALTDEILYCLSETGATDNMAMQLMPAMGVTGQGANYDIYKTASGNAVLSYYVENAQSGVNYGVSMEAVQMKIGNRAAVKKIRIANGVTAIVSMDSSTSAFGSTDIREIYIPDTVTAIGAYAFVNCANLERVYIPAGATLGRCAFASNSITDIYFGGTQEEWQEYDTSAAYFGILDSQYTVHYNATGLPE